MDHTNSFANTSLHITEPMNSLDFMGLARLSKSKFEMLANRVMSASHPVSFGADCLFQIISHRYEQGVTLLTTHRVYKQWAGIFNNDAVLTSNLHLRQLTKR